MPGIADNLDRFVTLSVSTDTDSRPYSEFGVTNMAMPACRDWSVVVLTGPMITRIELTADKEAADLARLARLTPSRDELRRIVANCPPPPAWMDVEEDNPFLPVGD